MDRNGIDMQVLSMAGPGVEEFDLPTGTALARSINDELAEAVARHPDRFAGLATVAYGDPDGAAVELERAVTKLGFKGAKVNSHVRGEYLDHPRYRAFWETAARLGVPVMLHPKDPLPGLLGLLDTYPGLTQAAWGFTVDAGTHALRLICSGLFDTCPKLQIVLGHLGEGIPFWLARIDNHWARSPKTSLKKKPSEYFRENFYVSTSGMFEQPAFQCVYQTLGPERILFAVDYPYESIDQAVKFIDAAQLPDSDREKICHANVERLLALRTARPEPSAALA
jgi:5-carboxyvanillate decarboxylase